MKDNEEYIKDAIELLKSNSTSEINSTFFKYRFAIGSTRNNQLLKLLELGGIISKPDKNGVRKVLMN